MDRTIQIHTLRTLDDDGVMHTECTDGRTCVGLHTIADRPGRTYLVVKEVTDPAEQAALAQFTKPGEILGWVPTELLQDGV